jgi:sec-independent protein translocase protein TatB
MFPEGRALEFLIAAVVALIVVGPKDLPVLLRKFGQFMAKVRSMAAEFRASFDEMARQSELDELRKEVEAMRKGQLADIATHAPEVNQAFDEISQGLSDVGVQLNSPVSYPAAAAETTIEVKPAPRPRARKTAAKTPATAAAAKKTPALKTVAKAKVPAPKAAVKKAATAKPVKAAAKAAPAKPRTRKATAS